MSEQSYSEGNPSTVMPPRLSSGNPTPPPLAPPANPAASRAWPALPQLLRWLGGLSIIAGCVAFMVSRWMEADATGRYLGFMGLTLLLSACGVFCARVWGEDRSARTFLALATVFMPAHFVQFGMMIMAELQNAGSPLAENLNRFAFQPAGPGALGVMIGAAGLVLAPITWLGFAAIARPYAKALTALFLVDCLVLLLPFREPATMAGIALGMLGALGFCEARYLSRKERLRDWDGRLMRMLMWMPLVVYLVRALMLPYPVTDSHLFTSMLCLVGAYLTIYVGRRLSFDLEPLGTITCLGGTLLAGAGVLSSTSLLAGGLTTDAFTLTVLPALLVTAALAPLCRSARGLVLGGSLFAATALTAINLWVEQTWLSGVLALGVAGLTIILGHRDRSALTFGAGLVGFAATLAYPIQAIYTATATDLWVTLAVTGVLAVLLAGWLDRYKVEIRQQLHTQTQRLRRHFQA